MFELPCKIDRRIRDSSDAKNVSNAIKFSSRRSAGKTIVVLRDLFNFHPTIRIMAHKGVVVRVR